MTTIELKEQVISRISKLSDNDLLMDVYKLLDNCSDDSEIFKLTDNHKIAIATAINQINNGDFLTNEQANNEIDAWLNK
jgi:hypothetical protein